MRAVIGDTPFNQRFLRLAATACGFDQIIGTTTAEDLVLEAASADLIVYDPRIERAGSPVGDVGLELLKVVPRDRLVIVTCSKSELERADNNGIVAGRKGSLLDLHDIQVAIALARDQHHAPALEPLPIAAGIAAAAGGAAAIETYDWDAVLWTSPSAYASVPTPAPQPTPQP
jgi:hypothetical protein